MRIPFQSLEPETLRLLLEEIITREGTDYGAREYSLEEKLAQAMQALETGQVIIEYDVKSETCTLAKQASG